MAISTISKVTAEDIPLHELLQDGEIAALYDEEKIFSVTPLHPVIESKGYFHVATLMNSDWSAGCDVYADSYDNNLILSYKTGAVSEILDGQRILTLIGLQFDRYAEFFDSWGRFWEDVDLAESIKRYPKNIFDSYVERVKIFLRKREESAKLMII